MTNSFKSGFVAIIGAPNVGKSTLLNQILKQKIVIVSPKAQTTRNKIQGIYSDDDSQIIFIDTPGVHSAINELGKLMNNYAIDALNGVDVVLMMVDATKAISDNELNIMENILKKNIPTILVANKVDKVASLDDLKAVMDTYKEAYPFVKGIGVSAASNYLVDELVKMIKELLHEGPKYYPDDQLLDQPIRFCVAEIIREKMLLLLDKEVPHSVAVEIDSFKYNASRNLTQINATIVCERDSQKRIIIGAKGQKIKEIGTLSRIDIAKLVDTPVYLELFVKVEANWRNHKQQLKSLGYSDLS